MENLSDDEDKKRAWESIKESTKTSAKETPGLHELKQHKPWFHDECSGFLDQRKQAKMQWVKDPSRYFRNKKKANLKAKFEELETNSKITNIRGLYGDIND